jgi:hypothetical protein
MGSRRGAGAGVDRDPRLIPSRDDNTPCAIGMTKLYFTL